MSSHTCVPAHIYYDNTRPTRISAALAEPGLRGSLSSSVGKLLGQENRGRSVRGSGGRLMEGREEVWTTDKEARGRAESKQRCMDTTIGGKENIANHLIAKVHLGGFMSGMSKMIDNSHYVVLSD